MSPPSLSSYSRCSPIKIEFVAQAVHIFTGRSAEAGLDLTLSVSQQNPNETFDADSA